MKKSFFLSVIFLLFILYYFLFPLTADREYVWSPHFQSDLDDLNGQSVSVLREPVCVQTPRFSGVLNPERESIVEWDHSSSKTYSCSHTFELKGPHTSILKNRTNSKYAVFEGLGYPLILNEHYLLTDFPSSVIKEVNTSGDILWSWEGVSPITALSASSMNVVFGTLDGKVYLFRKDGSERVFEPLSEQIDSVIYGLSLSGDGSQLAVVAGLNNQSLIIYREVTPLEFKESSRFELTSHYARPVKLSTSNENSSVWVEQPGELVRYSQRDTVSHYPFEGEVLTMIPNEEKDLIYILSKNDREEAELKVLSLEGRLLLRDKIKDIPQYFKYFDDQFSLILQDDHFILMDRDVF